MAAQNFYRLEGLTEALTAFLANPPADTAPVLLAALRGMLPAAQTLLPPRLFYEIVEQSEAAISVTDLSADILYANPAFERVTGYTTAEITGQNESVLSDKSTPVPVYESLWDQLTRQKPWTGMLINRRKDNGRYLAEVTVVPVLDEQGKAIYYLGIHRDITEWYHLQQELEHQKHLIESVVDAAPVAIVLLDENEQVLLGNPEYQKLSAFLDGGEPAVVFLQHICAGLGADWERLKTANGRFDDREVCLGEDTLARWFICSGAWFHDRDRSAPVFFENREQGYLLLVAKEVTDVKKQQAAIRINAMRALLAENEVTENMRESLSGAIYQFQQPLNMLSAAVNLLERRALHKNGDPLLEILQQALQAGKQAIETLEDGMPLSTQQAFISINLNELLRDVLSLATERMLSEGVMVDWQPAATLPNISAQESGLLSLFSHLVDNALDAMQATRKQRAPLLEIRTWVDADQVCVRIADNGPGIPADLRFKVFEPFFTTKPFHYGGSTGLGLTRVQEIINRHAGTLQLDADDPQGTRFVVCLPIHHQGE